MPNNTNNSQNRVPISVDINATELGSYSKVDADIWSPGVADSLRSLATAGSARFATASPDVVSDGGSVLLQEADIATPRLGSDEVQLGVTRFKVPPTNIRVVSISDSDSLPSLRSSTNTLVKSGRSRIRIDLSLIFPDIDSLNNELRELIVQFRLSPVLPLYSSYVAGLVYPTITDSYPVDQDGIFSPEIKAKNLRDLASTKIKELGEKIETLRSLISTPSPDSEFYTAYTAFDRLLTSLRSVSTSSITSEEITESINSIRSLLGSSKVLLKNGVLQSKSLSILQDVLDTFLYAQTSALEANNLEKTDADISKKERTNRVPVILNSMSIQNMEEYPKAVTVNLSLIYFNYLPYSKRFEFKGLNGDPTEQILDCPWFREYIKTNLNLPTLDSVDVDDGVRRFLKVRNSGTQSFGEVVFRYPTSTLRRVSTSANSLKQTFNSPSGAPLVSTFTTPVFREADNAYISEYREVLIAGGNARGIVPTQVNVNLVNRIAVQPILGSVYPTAQYIGGMNANVTISFIVTGDTQEIHDTNLETLLSIKNETDKVSILFGSRARRNNKIFIANDIVNLTGVRAVQLNNVVVETRGPMQSSVTMSFTEFTSTQNNQELVKLNTESLGIKLRKLIEFAQPEVHQSISIARKQGQADDKDILRALLGLSSLRSSTSVQARLLGQKPFLLGGLLYRDGIAAYVATKTSFEDASIPTEAIVAIPELRAGFLDIEKQFKANPSLDTINELFTKYEKLWKDPSTSSSQRDVYRQLLLVLIGLFPTGRFGNEGQRETLLERFRRSSIVNPDGEQISFNEIQNQRLQNNAISRALEEIGEATNGLKNPIVNDELLRGKLDTVDYTHPCALPLAVVKAALVRAHVVAPAKSDGQSISENVDGIAPDLDDQLTKLASALLLRGTGITSNADFSLLRSSGVLSVFGLDQFFDQSKTPVALPEWLVSHIVSVVSDLETKGSVDIKGLKNPPTGADLQTIYNAIVMAENSFPSFGEILQQSYALSRTLQSVYPDLNLPTYEVLYGDLIARINKRLAGRVQLTANIDLNSIKDKEAIQLLQKFIPTFLDLGVTPPPGLSPTSFARQLTSEVEPGFYWFHERTLTTQTPDIQDSNVKQAPSDLSKYIPAIKQTIQNIGAIDIDSAEHAASLLDASIKSFRDDAFSMARIYPTFKIYFVEPQNQSLGVIDDLYGYNSLLSIKLHKHKFFPDTLELDIVNFTGSLDDSTPGPDTLVDESAADLAASQGVKGALRQDSVSRIIARYRDEVSGLLKPIFRHPETGDKANLKNLFLREGTGIILKMGYSNNAEELETVFTGQVAEMRQGDIIKIVCQSHAAELTVPVNIGDKQSPIKTVAAVMDDEAPVHFGALKLVGGTLEKEVNGRLAKYAEDNLGNNVLRTRRLDNVFVAGDSANQRFRAPNKIGLEVLADVVRLNPGFVFGVRPYLLKNGLWESTLYVGLASQPYRYKDTAKDNVTEYIANNSGAFKLPNGQFTVPSSQTGQNGEAFVKALQVLLLWKTEGKLTFAPWTNIYLGRYLNVSSGVLPNGRTRINSNSTVYTTAWKSLRAKLGIRVLRECVRIILNDVQIMSTNTYLGGQERLVLTFEGTGFDLDRLAGQALEGLSYYTQWLYTETASKAIANIPGRDPFEYNVADTGSAFVSIPDWESYALALLAPMESEEEYIRKFVLHEDAGFRSIDGIEIKNWRDHCSRIARFTEAFREFIVALDVYLSASGNRYKAFVPPPVTPDLTQPLGEGYKPFRAYHWIDSDRHIMRNDIRATVESMANAIQLRYADNGANVDNQDGYVSISSNVNWKSVEIPYHNKLRPQDMKYRVQTDINAGSKAQASVSGLNSLAQALGDMYRGEIVIQGNERIKPFDIIYMFDWYNLIFGPIEVESVTHVLLSDTGFASIINPCAVTSIAGVDMKQLVLNSAVISKYIGAIDVRQADNVIRGTSDPDKPLAPSKTTTGVGDPKANVQIMPLTHNGRPWLAGLRGPEDSWESFDPSKGRWELWSIGQAKIALARLYNGEKQ